MSTVTDLSEYLKKREAEKDFTTVLKDYSVHESQLTLPLHAKLDVIRQLTLNGWMANQDIKAQEANNLVHVAKDILQGVHFPFKLLTSAAVRVRNDEFKDLSLYMFGGDVSRYDRASTNNESLVTNFQLELSYFELEPDEGLGTNKVYPVDLDVQVTPGDGITKNQVVKILTNINDLLYFNGGKSELINGRYVAFLPYSPKFVICIAYVPEIPFVHLRPTE